jgi:ATP/ADP translocase
MGAARMGAARMAKVPLILFDMLMILVLLMNVASLVVYLVVLVVVTNPKEYVFYILSIAFSISLLILGLVLTKYSRNPNLLSIGSY